MSSIEQRSHALESPIRASEAAHQRAVSVGARAYVEALWLSEHARAARPGVPVDAIETAVMVTLQVRLGVAGVIQGEHYHAAVRLAAEMVSAGLPIEAALGAALGAFRWRQQPAARGAA